MLELRVLGPLDLVDQHGAPIRSVLAQPKRTALLVYLAVDSPASFRRRDTLLATFWPERDRTRARNALNQALHFLRTALGPDAIETRGREELRIAPERLWCDAVAFRERLREGDGSGALELYGGDLLEGFHVDGVTRLERWLVRERAELRRTARDTAVALSAEARDAGRLTDAMARLRRALEIVPSDEETARELLRLLFASGRRAAAVREYRKLARWLERELGVAPSASTRQVLVEAGVDPDRGRGSGPELVRAPSPRRRLASRLTDRALELMQAGRAENAASRELLEQATGLDPSHGPAHAALARARVHWIQIFGGPWAELGSARAVARRALELEPELPEAHFARAFSLEAAGCAAEAARAYRALLRIQPKNREAASHLGRSLMFTGEFAAALSWMDLALTESGPRPGLLHETAIIHHCLGHTHEGDELYQRTLEAVPGFRWAEGSRLYWDLVRGRLDRVRRGAEQILAREPDSPIGLATAADVRMAAGDFEAAVRYYERCYQLDPGSRHSGTLRATRTALGFAHLRGGDPGRGRELLRAAEVEDRRALRTGAGYGGLHYDLASIHAARGQTEPALDWLESAFRAGWLQHELLAVDPVFASLRGDDRVEDIRRAMERTIRDQRRRLA